MTYMVGGSVFSVQRLGDGHFPGDGVNDVDITGWLISTGSRYAVPDFNLFILVRADLQRTAQIVTGMNGKYDRPKIGINNYLIINKNLHRSFFITTI